MNNKNNSLAGEIRALKVGETACLENRKLSVVQSAAYRMGKDLNRRYSVNYLAGSEEHPAPIMVTRLS